MENMEKCDNNKTQSGITERCDKKIIFAGEEIHDAHAKRSEKKRAYNTAEKKASTLFIGRNNRLEHLQQFVIQLFDFHLFRLSLFQKIGLFKYKKKMQQNCGTPPKRKYCHNIVAFV